MRPRPLPGPPPPPGTRFVRIAKSPAAPNAAFAYRVTGAGLELVEDVEAPAALAAAAAGGGSVVHARIANEVPYEQAAAWGQG